MMIVGIGLVAQTFAGRQAQGARLRQPAAAAAISRPADHRESAAGLPRPARGTASPAPKGTPREIVDKLSAETQKIFGDPAFRDKFLAPAVTFSIASPPEQFAERMAADFAKWGKVIKDAGIKVE